MLSAYADECVDVAIIDGLRRRGMDVVTARDRNQLHTDDEILLETATAEDRILLTNDPDFLRINTAWLSTSRPHSGIVFWPQTLPIGDAVIRILGFAARTSPADAENDVAFI